MRKVWLTAITVGSIVGICLGTLRGPLSDAGDRLWPIAWLAWPLVGWVILSRRPGNRIGIACLLIGAVWGVAFALQSVVLDLAPSGAAYVELVYTVLGVGPWLIIVWVVVAFPTGTYEGRLERFLGRSVIVVGSWAMIGFLISPVPFTDTGLDNPLAVPGLSWLVSITSDSGFLLVIALGVTALVALIRRSRHSTGVERQQYRWLMLGALIFLLVAGVGQVTPEDSPANLAWLLGGIAIPASIGVAVVNYRLYEIDRVVSRTVSYTLVVGLLAAVFLGAVTAFTTLLPEMSDLAVAASTLAVAALFNPVRRRIQSWVDRRFNRSRYDAEKVMDRFVSSLQDRMDPDVVVNGWVGVVAETMQPTTVGVWVREG